MAQMYPDEGPAEDCESSAERKLYYRFREQLGPEYYIVHSAKWNAVAANGRMQAGEADFIVIHPQKGILVLEVKGGRVQYDPHSARWYVLDRNDHKDRIRDPFTQAMSSVKILERKLRTVARTRPYADTYHIAYGVWFPDMAWTRGTGGDFRLIDEQVLDRSDINQPERALDRLFAYAHGTTLAPPLSTDALTALLSLLAPDLTAGEGPLSQRIDDESPVMERLTGEQFARLHLMWHTYRQLAVPGHAGTGKTVIALEMAWRLAQSGVQVLLLCANQTLADYLRHRVDADRRLGATTQLHIRSLKELATELAQAGGIRLSEISRLDVSLPSDQSALAEIVSANLDALNGRGIPVVLDAILVDEAQDLDEPLWAPLRRLLRPSDDTDALTSQGARTGSESNDGVGVHQDVGTADTASHFYAFYDPAQRLMPGEWDPAWTGLPVLQPPLVMNCRNTRAIHDLMAQLNDNMRDLSFIGPAGDPIKYEDPQAHFAQTEGLTNGRGQDTESLALARVLDDLTGRQHIKPEQILIITCRSTVAGSPNATRWLRQDQRVIGRHELRWLGAKRTPGTFALATIRSAKGMESPVVILAELDGVAQDPRRKRLLYAAVSRARNHLVVLGPPDIIVPKPPDVGLPQHEQEQGQKREQESASTGPASTHGAPNASPRDRVFQPSEYQQAIFDSVTSGRGDGIVTAVAGSGKTTTLVEAAKLIDVHDALFIAFNKHIAETLGRRLKGTRMSAKTIHSIGLACLGRYLAKKELDIREHKYVGICRAWIAQYLRDLGSPEREEAYAALERLVDLARLTLTPLREDSALRRTAEHYGVTVESDPRVLSKLFPAVAEIVGAGEKMARDEGVIDYTDMLYLPYHWRLRPWRVRWVFVDEAQDLSAAQLDLALKCRAPGGRMLFVGDPHQAIYGFAGADTQAFANIKRRTQAKELPLSICYRCPTSHLALAREIVPDIEARLDAPAGIFGHVNSADLHTRVRKDDLILCRKTAPLVEQCIRLIQHSVFAQVKGRDIGTDLTKVVQDVTRQPGYSWRTFGRCLEEYERRQSEKLMQADGMASQLQSLRDRVAAVQACYQSFDAADAGQLCKRIEELFHDEHPDVLLSTVHRAKGLERDRVFILEPDAMPLHWPGQQGWELEQEHNIRYVALTRSRSELYFVAD